jgi:hypothetical protein
MLLACRQLTARIEDFAAAGKRNSGALSRDRVCSVADFYAPGGLSEVRVSAVGVGRVSGHGPAAN